MAKYQHTLAEGDPYAVPIRAAATVMIVADRPELEVLLVQRTSRMAFGAKAWVFPGGRVDPTDQLSLDVVDGLTDEQASSLLEVPEGGLAWWLAAVRETLEEAGLLLACDACTPGLLELVRTAAHDDADHFVRALSAHRLRLDLSGITEVARFITPLGPPRRFDTRFFLAAAPAGQTVVHDPKELDGARWIRPAEAIAEWRADSLPLMSVTHRMLACLSRYQSTAEVIETSQNRPPARRVRVNDPDGDYDVLLPGEPGYETAELEIEHGWVRL